MGGNALEKYYEAASRTDEAVIELFYSIFGSEKISMAKLKKIKILQNILRNGVGKKSVAKIAKENKVSRMTVYRLTGKPNMEGNKN